MEQTIYTIMSKDKKGFRIIYADDCEKTDDSAYLTSNAKFKCWLERGGEKSLHISIYPMFGTKAPERARVLEKIRSAYRPECND